MVQKSGPLTTPCTVRTRRSCLVWMSPITKSGSKTKWTIVQETGGAERFMIQDGGIAGVWWILWTGAELSCT